MHLWKTAADTTIAVESMGFVIVSVDRGTPQVPTPLKLPFPPLVMVEGDQPLRWADLEPLIQQRLQIGVSLCILRRAGDAKRGGYFFHIKKTTEGYTFCTFDRAAVCAFADGEKAVAFINHVSGREYSDDMWRIAQHVNLRSDGDSA